MSRDDFMILEWLSLSNEYYNESLKDLCQFAVEFLNLFYRHCAALASMTEIATLESQGGHPSLDCGRLHPKEQPFHHLYLDMRVQINNILLMFWYFEGQAKLSHLVKRMSVQPNYQEKCKLWAKRQCKDFNVAMFLVRGVVCKCAPLLPSWKGLENPGEGRSISEDHKTKRKVRV